MAIDDPLHQVDQQHPDDPQVVAKVLNVLGPLLAILSPSSGAVVSLAGYFRQLLDTQRSESRMEAFRKGLVEAYRELGGKLKEVEARLGGIEAEEAVVAAARGALLTARIDRAYQMGRVLGSTLGDNDASWREAAEFIRTLEEFTDDDLQAIRILWRVQLIEYRDSTNGPLQMSTDNAAYLSKWSGVLDHVKTAGISKDDWLSRCARLSGFGLTVPVDSPNRSQSKDLPCYRLTTRAVRLLKVLGQFVPPGTYPVVRYHPDLGSRTFHNEDEDALRGPGWFDDSEFMKQSPPFSVR